MGKDKSSCKSKHCNDPASLKLQLNYYITPAVYLYINTNPPTYPTVTLNFVIQNLCDESFNQKVRIIDSLIGCHKVSLKLKPYGTKRIDIPYTLDENTITKERLIGSAYITHKCKRISNFADGSAEKATSFINPDTGEYEINATISITPNPYIINPDGTVLTVSINLMNTFNSTITRDLVFVIPLGNGGNVTFDLGTLTFGPNEVKNFTKTYTLTPQELSLASIIIKGFVALKALPTYGVRISNIATTTAVAEPCSVPAGPNINWDGCDKSGITLTNIGFEASSFIGTNFSGATFIGVTGFGSDFSNANFTNANLSSPSSLNPINSLIFGTFVSADFSGADLSYSAFNRTARNCKFIGATLVNTFFSVNPPDPNIPTDLAGSDFTNANLQNAVLNNSKLFGANLTNADLSNAKLNGSILSIFSLPSANLTNANLTNTNFSGVTMDPDISGTPVIGIPINLPTGWSVIGGILTYTP